MYLPKTAWFLHLSARLSFPTQAGEQNTQGNAGMEPIWVRRTFPCKILQVSFRFLLPADKFQTLSQFQKYKIYHYVFLGISNHTSLRLSSVLSHIAPQHYILSSVTSIACCRLSRALKISIIHQSS